MRGGRPPSISGRARSGRECGNDTIITRQTSLETGLGDDLEGERVEGERPPHRCRTRRRRWPRDAIPVERGVRANFAGLSSSSSSFLFRAEDQLPRFLPPRKGSLSRHARDVFRAAVTRPRPNFVLDRRVAAAAAAAAAPHPANKCGEMDEA